MPRSRVSVKGSIGKSIRTGSSSTTVQNTTVVQQVTRNVGGVSGTVGATIWPLIGQIPLNVLDLAALSASGLVVCNGTDIITRSLAAGSSDVVVTNATGAAGNPTIDLGTSVKASLALAATSVQPGSLAPIATSGSASDLSSGTVPVLRLAPATTGAFGVVKPDGTTITITAGVISAVGGGGASPLTTKGDLYGYNTTDARIPVGTDGQVLTADSTNALGVSYQTISGSGTVTSVELTLPSIFSVSGSPITGAGTLASTLATQNANWVWAGPASGSAAAPTFRAIAAADLPLATTGAFGAVKPDGTTIAITAGVISAVGGGTPVPASIPDLLYWFAADRVNSSNLMPVQMMSNSYTPYAARTMVPSTPTSPGNLYLVPGQNGLPVVATPSGSNGRMTMTNGGIQLHKSTVFYVIYFTGSGGSVFNGDGSAYANQENTGGAITITCNLSALVATAASGVVGAWHQINATYDDSTGAYAFRKSSASNGSGTSGATMSGATHALFWNPGNGGEDWGGYLAEQIVYNRVLSSGEISSVEAYLAAKWGVT